jgi:hypothetical protein
MKQDSEETADTLDKKLAKYLAEEGLTSLDPSVLDRQLERLFFTFTRDFLKYQIFFDDYSTLCEKLLIVLQDKEKRRGSDLFSICNYGAELSWYIRNNPARAADFLDIMLRYYREHSPDTPTK